MHMSSLSDGWMVGWVDGCTDEDGHMQGGGRCQDQPGTLSGQVGELGSQ